MYFKPRGKAFVCRDREMSEELKDSLQDRIDSVKHSKLFLIKMRHKLERALGGVDQVRLTRRFHPSVAPSVADCLVRAQAPSAYLPDIADLSKEFQACWKSLNDAEDRASTDADLVAGGMDSLTEKQHLDFLKKCAVSFKKSLLAAAPNPPSSTTLHFAGMPPWSSLRRPALSRSM